MGVAFALVISWEEAVDVAAKATKLESLEPPGACDARTIPRDEEEMEEEIGEPYEGFLPAHDS